MKMPHIADRNAPTMRVLATYTDRELLAALLDIYNEMPDDDAWDFDQEGHDECQEITVCRPPLREAFRRLAADERTESKP